MEASDAQRQDTASQSGQEDQDRILNEVDDLTQTLLQSLERMGQALAEVRDQLGLDISKMPWSQADSPEPVRSADTSAERDEAHDKWDVVTANVPLVDVLSQVPPGQLLKSGFDPQEFEPVLAQSVQRTLVQFEQEMVALQQELGPVVAEVRRLQGKPKAHTPALPLADDERLSSRPTTVASVRDIVDDLTEAPWNQPEDATEPEQHGSAQTASSDRVNSPKLEKQPPDVAARPRGRNGRKLLLASLVSVSCLLGGGAAYLYSQNLTSDKPTQPAKTQAPDAAPASVAIPDRQPLPDLVVLNPESPEEMGPQPAGQPAEDPLPGNVARARSVGKWYLSKKDYQKAAWYLGPWVEQAPEDVQLRYLYARSLFYTNQLAAAAIHLERAVELRPDFADAYFELGGVYLKLGKRDAAAQALETFVRLRPDDERSMAVRQLVGKLPKEEEPS